jgi:mannose-1-phosphate guanylyltransferase/mannose-1-phosphate guanylyltransferase/phosphomannomutase
MTRAFVLGAGLGTRLRPLTSQLPKPLIPLHHRPLIEYAFEHLHGAGVREFVVNTHHLPDEFQRAFPDGTWNSCPVTFRHEPVLLETGGGLANVADLLDGGEAFFVYNGDIFTSMPLAQAMAQHRAAGNLATLILRSSGPVKNVALDVTGSRVIDLRNLRNTNHADQFQFTGVCLVQPAFFKYLSARGVIESLVPASAPSKPAHASEESSSTKASGSTSATGRVISRPTVWCRQRSASIPRRPWIRRPKSMQLAASGRIPSSQRAP